VAVVTEQRASFALPRLLYLIVLKLSGGDFRSGMVFNAVVLGALSYALMRAAQYARGGEIRYADAFFPLVLLHLGHWENLVWGWQIQFVVSVALTCVLLLVIVTETSLPTPPSALVAGATLILLPMSGANGLVITLALSPWFALRGVWVLRANRAAGRPRWPGRAPARLGCGRRRPVRPLLRWPPAHAVEPAKPGHRADGEDHCKAPGVRLRSRCEPVMAASRCGRRSAADFQSEPARGSISPDEGR
jgi:hypothetical protein